MRQLASERVRKSVCAAKGSPRLIEVVVERREVQPGSPSEATWWYLDDAIGMLISEEVDAESAH